MLFTNRQKGRSRITNFVMPLNYGCPSDRIRDGMETH